MIVCYVMLCFVILYYIILYCRIGGVPQTAWHRRRAGSGRASKTWASLIRIQTPTQVAAWCSSGGVFDRFRFGATAMFSISAQGSSKSDSDFDQCSSCSDRAFRRDRGMYIYIYIYRERERERDR